MKRFIYLRPFKKASILFYRKKRILILLSLALLDFKLMGQARNEKPVKNRDSINRILDSMVNHRKSKTLSIQEISVTATKFPKSLSELGKVVDIIGPDQIAESQGKNLGDILNEVPGLGIEGIHSNPGLAPKTLFVQGASGDNTLVLIDGIPISDPSSLGSNFDIRLVNPEQFERIEILKGGQSTLYGSDAVAGVINLISRKPLGKGFKVLANLSGGSYGTFKENIILSQKIDSTLNYLMGYTHYKTNGLVEAIDNGSDSAHTGHFHRDGMIQNNLFFSANWNKGRFRISPNLEYSSISGKFSNGAYMDGINPYFSHNLVTGLNGRWILGSGSNVYFNEGFTYTKRFYGGAYPSGYTGRFNQLEAYLDQDFGKYLQLLGGLNYQIQQVLDTASNSIKRNPSISILSPYLSLFLNSRSNIHFSVGGRLNHHSSYGNNLTFNINPSWNWNKPGIKFFADYASSFRAPKLPELYGEYGANPNLKPENSESLEFGISGNLRSSSKNNPSIKYRVLGFFRNIQNAIIYLYPKGYINQDEQSDKGYEAFLSLVINPEIRLQASLAVVTGKVRTKSINTGMDTLFNNLIRRPKNTLHFGVFYHPLKSLNFSILFSNYSDRLDEDFNTGSFIVLPNYHLLDAGGSFLIDPKRNFHLFFQMGNILNSQYSEIIGFNTMKFHYTVGLGLNL